MVAGEERSWKTVGSRQRKLRDATIGTFYIDFGHPYLNGSLVSGNDAMLRTSIFDGLSAELAQNRSFARCVALPINPIRYASEAYAIQAGALEAFDNDYDGYALVGTNEKCLARLGLSEPIFSPIPQRSSLTGDHAVRLPQGVIGAQCELAFILARTYPDRDEEISLATAASAILSCHPAISLLAQRAKSTQFPDLLAIADFALHAATVIGRASGVGVENLGMGAVVARIDGQLIMQASPTTILGHPVNALVWLARKLEGDGRRIGAGEIVTTGSALPILQVLPGQRLTVDVGGGASLSCSFD